MTTKPETTLFEKGLHLITEREHYKALDSSKRWIELMAYRARVRGGENPLSAAAAVIVWEYAS